MFASLLLSFAVGHQTAKPITIELPVCTVGKVLESIGEQTGEKFATSGAVRDDFVFVKVKDFDSELLLQRLAKLVDGKWLSGNGVRTLTAPENFDSESDLAFQRSIQSWMNNIQKKNGKQGDLNAVATELDEVQKKLQDGGPTVWEKMQTLQAELPIAQFYNRLLIEMAPQIMKIKEGERVVFSLNPTSLQLPIPANADTLATYRRNYFEFREILLKKGLINLENTGVYYGNALSQYGAVDPPQNFIITVTRTMDNATAEIKFWDKDGNFTINDNLGNWQNNSDPLGQGPDNPLKNMTQLVEPPKGATDYAPLVELMMGRVSKPGQNYEESAAKICDFVKNDPLAVVPTDVLQQYSKAVNKNVIAYVPDTAIQLYFFFATEIPNQKKDFATLIPAMLRTSIMGASSLKLEDKDGLQSLRGEFLGPARKMRMPRLATTALLKSLKAKKRFDLDVFADFIKQVRYDESLTLVSLYAAFAAQKRIEMPQGDHLKLVRFYAEYNQGIRDKMKQSQVETPLDQLTIKQKEIVGKFIYKSDAGLLSKEELGANQQDEEFGFSDTKRYGYGISNIKQEPTFLLAKGLPSKASTIMTLQTLDNLFMKYESEGFAYPRSISIGSLVYELIFKEKGVNPEYYARPRTYLIAPSTMLKLDIVLQPLGQMSKYFTLDEVPVDGKWGDLTALPQNVQKLINDKLVKVREELKDAQFGPSGRTVKPPLF